MGLLALNHPIFLSSVKLNHKFVKRITKQSPTMLNDAAKLGAIVATMSV